MNLRTTPKKAVAETENVLRLYKSTRKTYMYSHNSTDKKLIYLQKDPKENEINDYRSNQQV